MLTRVRFHFSTRAPFLRLGQTFFHSPFSSSSLVALLPGRSTPSSLSLKKMLAADSPNFCYACFSGKYPVQPSGIVKRVGDFVDDGLNGSIDSIDGGWLQGSKDQKGKDLDINFEEQDGKVPV